MDKILVIAAHPDDEILGVGGTIAKRVKKGDEAVALILGEGQTSRWGERSLAPDHVIQSLHRDSEKAGGIIGYREARFGNLPDNRFDSVDFLDIVKLVEGHILTYGPDIIYTHHGGDLNMDHCLTYRAVLTGTRPMKGCGVREIYAFETLSSTEWDFSYGGHAFTPNVFQDIGGFMEQKCAAMEQYQSELCQWPHPRSLEGIRVSAQRWGMVAGCEYGEAFELVRSIG